MELALLIIGIAIYQVIHKALTTKSCDCPVHDVDDLTRRIRSL